MSKEEILKKLDEEIEKEKEHLKNVDEKDYIEQGITLGKINGLLTAKLIVLN